MTAAANGEDIGTGVISGMFSGAVMGLGAGLAAYFIAPVMIGVGATIAGTTLSVSTSLLIGTSIAFISGFIGGSIGDAINQKMSNGYISDWTSIMSSGIQGAGINILGTFLPCMGGPLGTFENSIISTIFSNLTGSLSLLFDSIRKRRKNK